MRSFAFIAAAISIAVFAGAAYWYYQRDSEPDVRVVDVSPQDFYQDAHIPGAVQVDWERIDQALDKWSKETPIVFYCSNFYCDASQKAAQKARDRGFKHAYTYKGGIAEWYQLSQKHPDEYTVAGPAQASYLSLQLDVPEKVLEKDIVISAQELQKLRKTGILPNKE